MTALIVRLLLEREKSEIDLIKIIFNMFVNIVLKIVRMLEYYHLIFILRILELQ